MKTCARCCKNKDISEYNNNKAKKDGLQSECRECTKTHSKTYYKANKSRMCQQITEKHKIRSANNRVLITQLKADTKCHFCKEDEPYCLDYHHKNPEDKLGCVSTMIGNGLSLKAVMKEIAKCVLLCANCHRKLHIGKLKL